MIRILMIVLFFVVSGCVGVTQNKPVPLSDMYQGNENLLYPGPCSSLWLGDKLVK